MNADHSTTSFSRFRTLCFWWVFFFLLQQGQRWVLLPEAWRQEVPSWNTLWTTLLTGVQADFIVATLAIGVVAMLGWFSTEAFRVVHHRLPGLGRKGRSDRAYTIAGFAVGIALLIFLTIDLGYYYYAHTHVDFVFFEYLHDLLPRQTTSGLNEPSTTSQAIKQTQAEIGQWGKWATIVGMFGMVEALLVGGWAFVYRRYLDRRLIRWRQRSPRTASYVFMASLILGLSGFNWFGPWAVLRTNISSSVYYILAQNPVWYAGEVWGSMLFFHLTGGTDALEAVMPIDEAIARSRAVIDPHGTFPSAAYPFVRESHPSSAIRLSPPVNVLVIVVEGLDRRYLGRFVDADDPEDFRIPFIYRRPQYGSFESASLPHRRIRVTPFLDRLRHESLYFEHFFSNGDQTSRALFSALCSYVPRRGAAVMKTRYTQEFLCLPQILQEAGYRTEMIVGQNRDRNYDHIGLFLAKNGLHRLLDENDFPSDAERIGLGISDNALFEFVAERIRHLREQSHPYFLATLTVGTHHPYSYPIQHPDVEVLRRHEDQYVPALRVLDFALERFFSTLQREALLDRTIVFLLGDHGRHEGIGGSDPAARGSHFLVPLYIWVDPSLAAEVPTRTNIVTTIASHVDLAPTILAMTNTMPPLAPFLGHDLSCAFAGRCPDDRVAYLSGAHDDVIGLADRHGVWLYAFRRQTLFRTSLDGSNPEGDTMVRLTSPRTKNPNGPFEQPYRDMLAMYVSTNFVLEEGRVWSRSAFGRTAPLQ